MPLNKGSERARDRRFSVDVRLSVVGVIFAKSISKSPPCDFLGQRFSSEKHETLSGEQIRGERESERGCGSQEFKRQHPERS